MLSQGKQRALQALLTQPSKAEAARAAGIDPATMRRYMQDEEFLAAYRHNTTELLQDARLRGQQLLSPALETLAGILQDNGAKNTERIAAARSILEWSIRLTEFTDIVERLEALECDMRPSKE